MIDLDHAVKAARVDAQRHLEQQLDRLCLSFGLDPFETWRKPRIVAQLDRITAANAATRESARAGRPAMGGYLPVVKTDPRVRVGEALLRDERGRFVGRIRGIG